METTQLTLNALQLPSSPFTEGWITVLVSILSVLYLLLLCIKPLHFDKTLLIKADGRKSLFEENEQNERWSSALLVIFCTGSLSALLCPHATQHGRLFLHALPLHAGILLPVCCHQSALTTLRGIRVFHSSATKHLFSQLPTPVLPHMLMHLPFRSCISLPARLSFAYRPHTDWISLAHCWHIAHH